MKKLCIVPFTIREYPLIQYLEKSFDIVSLVSPKGIGIEGENISIIKRTSFSPYYFSNSLLSGIRSADTVLISNILPSQKDLFQLAKRALEISLDYGKEILCYLKISDSEIATYKANYPCWDNLVYFPETEEKNINRKFYNKWFDINVPVLYVGETVPKCDSYDLFLKLWERFEADKKSVLALSEEKYMSLFKQPSFIFWKKELSPDNMVCCINSAIHELISQENPDVVLIHLPDPMIKYDDEYHFDFGLTAFMMSQALPGTGCIMCSPSHTPIQNFWDNISLNFTSKFGYEILGVCVSNVRIDRAERNSLNLYRCSQNEVEQEIKLLNTYNELNFFSLSDPASFDLFFKELSNYLFEDNYGVL